MDEALQAGTASRISPLGFQHFSDENLSFLPAEDFLNSSLSCLAFSQNHWGWEKTSKSRTPTCDQFPTCQTKQSTQCHIQWFLEVVNIQNIVSPPKKVLLFHNSPVLHLCLSVQRTQGATLRSLQQEQQLVHLLIPSSDDEEINTK